MRQKTAHRSQVEAFVTRKMTQRVAMPIDKGTNMENRIAVGQQPTVEAELEALQHEIRFYRKTLNNEAVWLFLATLGCWSVSNLVLQLVAYMIVVGLFGRRVSEQTRETRSSSALVKAVEERIAR